ncbi:hypothetical protein ACE11G_15405 [Gordonia sp. PS3]|uniref:hypothetical protein n=1 Tax=Gordonia TaxID=2053 RepID=UPI0005EE9036|nr:MULTISPECIES: hypothetical protein [Gordonia]KJR09926.1 hypothetical protein UG54_02720 [Gordonia sihwensis]KXT58540.1 hypothetical protein Y710_03180 [Gordonia sp. QH-12]
MIEPQGPLPPEVYWRRRLVAGVGAVVAIVVVILLIVWLSGGSDSTPDSKNAAAKSSTEPAAPSTAVESAPPSSEAPSGGGEHGQGGDPSATPSAPAPAPAQQSDAPAADAGAPGCSDQSLSVVLYTDKPTYTVGDQPVFTIVTTNGGLAACSRDVGKAAQNVIVRTLDGSRTLWSAQDCAPDKGVNIQVLAPGQQVTDTITWSGTTSNPGCTKKRVQVAAGGYQATAKLAERESAPITFNFVAPAQAPAQQ